MSVRECGQPRGQQAGWELRLFPGTSLVLTCPPPPQWPCNGYTGAYVGGVSSSNLRIWLMNSKCCFSSSKATACSLRCSFCCVPPAPRSHWFSCTKRRTWAPQFLASPTPQPPDGLRAAKITCGRQPEWRSKPYPPTPTPCPAWASWGPERARPGGAASLRVPSSLIDRSFAPRAPNRPHTA